MSSAPAKPRRPLRRILRRVALVLLVLLLLPYAIALIYRVVPPVSTLMAWRWATGARIERTWVPIDAIAPVLPLTVIGSEDGGFCRHHGVDFGQLREALGETEELSGLRGGSTIAQQTAKNLFLWPGRSILRKAIEFPLALWIDFVLPKRRLMEIYLNIAEWGPNGEFGAEAGSRYAFGKSARTLSAHEAALMAAILPNPILRSAQRPGPGIRRLAAIYERRARAAPNRDTCLRARRTP